MAREAEIEAAFARMAADIISDLLRLQIQRLVTDPLRETLGQR